MEVQEFSDIFERIEGINGPADVLACRGIAGDCARAAIVAAESQLLPEHKAHRVYIEAAHAIAFCERARRIDLDCA